MRRRRIGNRRRKSPEEISGIIEGYERSGLTQRDFAASRGVALATLGGWLRRARRARFVEVRAEGAARTETLQRHYAVELSAGIRIEVPRGFESAELGALLAELKGAGCLP